MKGIVDMKNIGIDLFKNIIKEARHDPTILDSYSPNQFKSKENLLEHIDMFLLEKPNVVILGSWFGSILVPALADMANKISCIDIDDRVIGVGKSRLFTMYDNVDWITSDVFHKDRYGRIKNADLIINTSCEPMANMSGLSPLKESNAYFAFQSNDMYSIKTHVNCVSSLDEFVNQLPTNAKILSKDEIKDDRGTRFTITGKLCAE